MTEQQTRWWDSAVAVITVTLVCATVGLFGLPLLFAVSLATSAWSTPAWLVAAVLFVIGILVVFPRLAPSLSTVLLRRATSPSTTVGPHVTPSQTLLLARLALFGIALVVTQAIVRRPVALLLGGEQSASPVEAGIAAVALAVVLALLVWLYQTGRPIVQSLTLRAIDAAVPTVTAAPLAEPTRTVSPVATSSEATGTVRVGPEHGATLPAPSSVELTMVSHRRVETVVTPGGDERTIASTGDGA